MRNYEMLRKIKGKLKEPLENWMYAFLMREASSVSGRKLFDAQELKFVTKALLSQNLFGINGTMVSQLERDFAHTYDVPYAVASTSGTAAIHTALGALDLNPGDEVITAPITDIGSIVPIIYQNAIPVFADIDDTYNMSPSDVERKITPRTRAIIVVHLFGNPCDMEKMLEISKRHNVALIEDCAQAHITDYKGRYVGSIGDIGCFSFQQAKHMTTGDGGMTITSDKAYYEKMKLFVDKNYARKGWGSRAYLSLAPNYRMNELTASVGLAQLKKVKNVVKKRHELGQYMTKLISDIKEIIPAPITQGSKHSYWLYPILLKNINIELFASEMRKRQIWVSAGYTGKPIYLCSEALTMKRAYGDSQCPFSCKYASKNYEYGDGLCPKAEEALKHLICVPLDETWDKLKVEKTARAINESIKSLVGGFMVNIPSAQDFKSESLLNQSLEIKTDKLRIGIIGCGQMGRWHFEAYKQNPNVELVAFVDTDYRKAEELSKKTSGKVYKTHKDMIQNERLDGVSICTVPSSHKEIALGCLNAGINVLCEKPLAISATQAKEMVYKANEKKLLSLTAFKFRFFDEVLKARGLIQKGSLGRILNFRLMFGGYMNMVGTWYVQEEISGGGIIMDSAPHAIDLIRYLFGEIETVSAQKKNYQEIEVEDTAKLVFLLKNGASGTVDLSWSVAVPPQTYLEIYGEDGSAFLDLKGITYKFKTWVEWKRVPSQVNSKEAFARQIDHFVEAIIGKKPSITNNEDGLRSQIAIESAYESIDKDGKIYISEKETI